MSKYPFEVGDKVVALASANDEYDITREGWEGEITQVDPESDDDIRVVGDGLETHSGGMGTWVCSQHFEKTSKSSSLGGQSLTGEIVGHPHKQPTNMSKMEEAAMAFRMATEPMKKHQVKLSLIMEVDALDSKHAAQQAEKNYYDAMAGTSIYMPNVVVDEVEQTN